MANFTKRTLQPAPNVSMSDIWLAVVYMWPTIIATAIGAVLGWHLLIASLAVIVAVGMLIPKLIRALRGVVVVFWYILIGVFASAVMHTKRHVGR